MPDMYIKFDGIDGESKDDRHADEIDVLSWSWGAARADRRSVEFQDLSFVKHVDSTTPKLLELLALGKATSGQLSVVADGEERFDHITIKFDAVRISALTTGGSGGEQRLTENISFNFTKFVVTVVSPNEDGSPGEAVSFGWDVRKNAKG